MADVLFKVGLQSAYDGLAQKDPNAIYFTTDTLKIYRGDKEYTKSVSLVSALPQSGAQGVVYVNTTTFTLHAWNGTEFVALSKGYAALIDDNATDATVPTAKAVKDYVTKKIADVTGGTGIFVTDVEYVAASGSLNIAKGSESENVVLSGVVNNPTYDAATRKITLPVFGGDALVINLGKDLVVESGSYNAEKKTIDLVLTSGDTVTIPVGSLIDIYTGIATASATVSVSEDNVISVDIKLSATANNQIVIEEDGLYVPLPDAYTKKEVDDKLATQKTALEGAIATAKSEAISAAAADATSKADAAKAAAISTAATDATTKANKALVDAKSYADGLNTAMDGRVKPLEDALTWGTI